MLEYHRFPLGWPIFMGYVVSGRVFGCLLGGSSQDLDTWLGSPLFISHKKAIWKGKVSLLRGLTITMAINHLLNGMILQVG